MLFLFRGIRKGQEVEEPLQHEREGQSDRSKKQGQRQKERKAQTLRLRREHEAEALRLRRQQQQQEQRRALVAKLRGFPARASGLPRAGAGSRSPFRYGLPRWYLPPRR